MTLEITIYTTKKIVTMNPSNPEGAAVAGRDGHILGVGTLEELEGWGPHKVDDTFKEKVLIPGLVEAHAHVLEGVAALFPYSGFFDRPQPDGSISKGIKSYAELVEQLQDLDAQMADQEEPLITMGFDPIYFIGKERLSVKHLDQVSTTRSVDFPVTCQWADFTVLSESPLEVDPMAIKDIPVWGTVLGGKKFPAAV